MVGKTNLELESIINNTIASQRQLEARLDNLEKNTKAADKRINSRFESLEKKLDDAEKKSDDRFSEIMEALASLQPNKDKEKGKEKVTFQTQQLGLPASDAGKQSSLFRVFPATTSKVNLSQPEEPPSKSLKLQDALQPSYSGPSIAQKRKFKPVLSTQYHSLPPQSSSSAIVKEGAINLYRPITESTFVLTEREHKIRNYFPDFFPKSEAENPNGPLREASNRNKVSFPIDCKLKYAGNDVLEKLYKMQVIMIQAMLPLGWCS
ncbi:hypothetical protein EV44_g3563 [Erysiphe necator]|uniref:Uncharacterized protein n=1 Tax=Uncinula necator TaxID=52586 RepID=A0A0B1P3C3_UNCNE|nr:hypothetical protein EV44_g3563 [Erysiphe necator]